MKIATIVLFVALSLAINDTVIGQTTGAIRCGDIVEGEVIADQSETADAPMSNSRSPITFDSYHLELDAGTRIDLTVTPLGDTFNPVVVILDSGGNDIEAVNESVAGQNEQLIDYPIGSSNQVIRILGARPDGMGFARVTGGYSPYHFANNIGVGHFFGAYEIRLGCTLRSGSIILPGDLVSVDDDRSGTQLAVANFSGFGFPGIGSVDFSEGIELPLSLAQAQTAPVASDVALYTYAASAGETATLTLSRVSGDISIGVTVTNRDTNEIIFFGGMPSSNNLSVELTFPSDGTYVVGLFRADTAERIDTSGAVQITLE